MFHSVLSGTETIGSAAAVVVLTTRSSDMERTRMLSRTFRSLKNNKQNLGSKIPSISSSSSPPPIKLSAPSNPKSRSTSNSDSTRWCVYLILSTNAPIKTYVGVTTDFPRRLKQHNGELKGGAKASTSGRPWVCACIIRGFRDHSEACSFEFKWKNISKKVPRKRLTSEETTEAVDHSRLLLQHRQAALSRVKCVLDCGHLEIDWQLHVS